MKATSHNDSLVPLGQLYRRTAASLRRRCTASSTLMMPGRVLGCLLCFAAIARGDTARDPLPRGLINEAFEASGPNAAPEQEGHDAMEPAELAAYQEAADVYAKAVAALGENDVRGEDLIVETLERMKTIDADPDGIRPRASVTLWALAAVDGLKKYDAGEIMLALARLEEARVLYEAEPHYCSKVYRSLQILHLLPDHYALLAGFCDSKGLAKAARLLQGHAVRLTEEGGRHDGTFHLDRMATLAEMQIKQGEIRGAVKTLSTIINRCEALAAPEAATHATALVLLSDCRVEEGRLKDAQRLLDQSAKLAKEEGLAVAPWPILLKNAAVAELQGDLVAAEHRLAAASAAFVEQLEHVEVDCPTCSRAVMKEYPALLWRLGQARLATNRGDKAQESFIGCLEQSWLADAPLLTAADALAALRDLQDGPGGASMSRRYGEASETLRRLHQTGQ